MSAPRGGVARASRTTTSRAARREQLSRLAPTILGMFLFIGSEAMLFGAFFTAYFFVRVVNPTAPETWPPEPYEFPKFVAGINTARPRHVELHDALGAAVDQARTTGAGSRRAWC